MADTWSAATASIVSPNPTHLRLPLVSLGSQCARRHTISELSPAVILVVSPGVLHQILTLHAGDESCLCPGVGMPLYRGPSSSHSNGSA